MIGIVALQSGSVWTPALLVASACAVGSFIGTLVHRLPIGGSVTLSRSVCPHCGECLAARDLVPLLSWILLHGRCRFCGTSIGWFYPAIEIAALAIAAWASTRSSGVALWASCAFGWLLLALAVIDWRHYLLPDVLTLLLAAGGIAWAAWQEPADFDAHVLGALCGFAAFALVAWTYRRLRDREGLGLGDAKLLAALGSWVTWRGLPDAVALAAALALLVALIQRKALDPAAKVPFGSYLALAGWLVWLYGPFVFG